jgi:hypothetical protein
VRGSAFAAIAFAVIGGVIIADVLIHPQGTTAAGNAAIGVTVPAYSALLGTVPSANFVKN